MDRPTIFCIRFVLLALGLVFAGCSPSASKDADSTGLGNDKVVLMLNWYPEAEHGGFYAAQVHGIFEQFGLDVEIRPGGPNAPVAQELVTGRVQFAIGNADDVLLFRQQDAPVVAVMAPIQNTPRCILVREDSGIDSLDQLRGLTLQANVGRPFLNFLESKGKLEGVQVVPYSGSVAKLVTDPKTAIQAYSFSEPLMAEQQGVAVRMLMLSDAGFNPYASCLMTTEAMIGDRRDTVARMVVACREGWKKYLEAPDATNAVILAANEQGMSKESLDFGVKVLTPLCLPEGMEADELGAMSSERWETLVQQFIDLELVEAGKVSAGKAYTVEFLDRAAPN